VHVVDVTEVANEKGRGVSVVYKVTSTVMLWMETHKKETGAMTLGGNMTRQHEATLPAVPDRKQHIGNIGQLVEDAEIKMRGSLNDIYFGKTKDIVNDLRSVEKLSDKAKQRAFQEEIARRLEQRGIAM
jgi:capping protein beta